MGPSAGVFALLHSLGAALSWLCRLSPSIHQLLVVGQGAIALSVDPAHALRRLADRTRIVARALGRWTSRPLCLLGLRSRARRPTAAQGAIALSREGGSAVACCHCSVASVCPSCVSRFLGAPPPARVRPPLQASRAPERRPLPGVQGAGWAARQRLVAVLLLCCVAAGVALQNLAGARSNADCTVVQHFKDSIA